MLDRKELIKQLYHWQNIHYQRSGMSIDDYPFICFDFCTNDQLTAYSWQLIEA